VNLVQLVKIMHNICKV